MTTNGTIRAMATLITGVFLCCIGGCASSAREIGAAASPAVVKSSLQQANAPDSQQQLLRLADSPALQRAGEVVGTGVAIGLSDQANKLVDGDAATTRATNGDNTLPGTIPSEGSPGVKQGMSDAKTKRGAAVLGLTGGGLNGLVKSSVQEAFLAATDPQFKAGEEAMSEAIGEGLVKGMITVLNSEGPALGDMVRKQLGPIVQPLIREVIVPAVRDMLETQLAPAALQVWREGAVETLKLTVRPDLQPDVIQNAQNASLGATRGTHQAMIDSGLLLPSGELNPHLKVLVWVSGIIAGIIVAAVLSLLLLLNLLVLHYWRHRRDNTAR